MGQYSRGADFERQVVKYLEKQNYLAFRCAGSKGNAKVDVIAIPVFKFYSDWILLPPQCVIDPYKTLLIQCKLSGIASQFEKEQLKMAAERFGCIPVIASKSNENGKIKFEVLT